MCVCVCVCVYNVYVHRTPHVCINLCIFYLCIQIHRLIYKNLIYTHIRTYMYMYNVCEQTHTYAYEQTLI